MPGDPVEFERWRPQRVAASENEAKVLAAARGMLQVPEVLGLEMRDIAAAAGVGVGTLYRRFGDKAGLLAAVIGDEEHELQAAILQGPPPLGPDAPARQRLDAFLSALIDLTERNLGALLITEDIPPGRLNVGAYAGWRLHVVLLLRQLRPTLSANDAGWYADCLLSTVDARLYAQQRRHHRLSRQCITGNVQALASGIVGFG